MGHLQSAFPIFSQGAKKHDAVTPSIRGTAIQSVLTKVKRRRHAARSTEPSMAGFRCVLKCFYSENISRIQNPPYCTWTKYRCTVATAYPEGNSQPATNAPAKSVQTF